MFCEMFEKIFIYDWFVCIRKCLRLYKLYWNEEFIELWRYMCEMEKKFLKCDLKERCFK